MKSRLYMATQTIPLPRGEVFAFFSCPRNLEAITPPWLKFRMVHQTTVEVGKNTELTYRLRVHGIPLTWVSRITEWEPGRKFVDEQIRGPYALWHHTHTFEDVENGTRIGDRVAYRLPLAPFSHWLAGPFVEADVNKIFEFRRRRIEELLPAEGSLRESSS